MKYDFSGQSEHVQLPEYYCKDHFAVVKLKQALLKVPPHKRAYAAAQYSIVYKEVYDSWPIDHQKENQAMRAANIRLWKYIEAFESVVSCKVDLPPLAK